MFSGISEKLRQFEASLADPLPVVPQPPRGTPSPAPNATRNQRQPISNAGSGRASPSIRVDQAESPTVAGSSSKSAILGDPSSQSASQLADQALSSLRQSFRKGRSSPAPDTVTPPRRPDDNSVPARADSGSPAPLTGPPKQQPSKSESENSNAIGPESTRASEGVNSEQDLSSSDLSPPPVLPSISKPDLGPSLASNSISEAGDATSTSLTASELPSGVTTEEKFISKENEPEPSLENTERESSKAKSVADSLATLDGQIVNLSAPDTQEPLSHNPERAPPAPEKIANSVILEDKKEGDRSVQTSANGTLDNSSISIIPDLDVQPAAKPQHQLSQVSAETDVQGAPSDLALSNHSLPVRNDPSEIGQSQQEAEFSRMKKALEDLRESQRLEKTSTENVIEDLRTQCRAKDSALDVLKGKLATLEKAGEVHEASTIKTTQEVEKLKILAKEEEEKRVKALSLLRALRQKLVKVEKEKEDMMLEKDSKRSVEESLREGLKADRNRFDQEIAAMRSLQEQQLLRIRQSSETERDNARAQFDREGAARKSQHELEVINLKASHTKEIGSKNIRIGQLEKTVRELSLSRDSLFDQLQLRTAEIESSSLQQDALQSQSKELQYELMEAKDRAAALSSEIEELRKARLDVSREDLNTRRLLQEAETRYENRVKELESKTSQLEKDRLETEEEMGRNLQVRLKEIERMRQQLAQKDIDYAESVHSRQMRDTQIQEGEAQRKDLQQRLKSSEALIVAIKADLEGHATAESAIREELNERTQRSSDLEARLEQVQNSESSLRSSNKVLREELRKLQSGVLTSEKQRNPGVGYFAAYGQGSGPISPTLSAETPKPQDSNSSTVSRSGGTAEEALNFEYIRNVILQFLERPEMRPHLVGVLGVILHFTPAESRRLVAKAGS